MVAVLNNGGGFYSAEHYIHEARMCGAIINPPCINKSDHPNIIEGSTIYLGFGYLKSLENLVVNRILTERQLYGCFCSLDDFIDRVVISIEQLTILIRIDSFRFTGISKVELLWQAIFKLNANKSKTAQSKLFKPDHKQFNLPKIETNIIEDAYDELELLGFPLCGYFDLINHNINDGLLATEMKNNVNNEILIYGCLVTTRYNNTSQGKLMRLSTFIDQEGNYFDAVHFENVVNQYPINGLGVYACYGKITNRFDFCSMIITWSKKIGLISDPRSD
jgi:DNA polymerase-3 subunit alpha